ncbi:MAG: type II secretion system protein [Deltaproteobacteria bacterium]|nr:type II secretion system protein [Deltaproteobacteria bacterium]
MNQIFRNKKGFTLIELAIVMVIVGLLIGIGAGMIGPMTKRAKIIDTRDIVNSDLESVISFASSNRRLPTIAEFPLNVKNQNDAWTKPLYYIVDPNLIAIPAFTSDAICGRRTTTYTICRDAACTAATNIQNVALILASGAENFNLQTGIFAGGICPAGQTCVRVYDADTPNIDDCTTAANCPNYPAALLINNPQAYDDITKWITLYELRTKIGCQGAQLRIVNNELPSGNVTTSYGATVYADGGIPYGAGGNYRWCLQTATGVLATDLPGFTVLPNVVNVNCQGLAEGSWGQATTFQFSKALGAGAARSYNFTVFVRDNNDAAGTNDNITQKAFVITISP